MIKLIINADDFGLNSSCTEAILEAFRKGYITDTTMVANGQAFDKAVELAKGELEGRVGIHFNITEGKPLTSGILAFSEYCSDGEFNKQFGRYKPLSKELKKALYEEFSAQVRKISDAGVSITHIDSHHHIHTAPFIAKIIFRVCKENGIKAMRIHRNIGNFSAYKLAIKIVFNKALRKSFASTDYFGSLIDVENGLNDGLTEIMVHPEYDKDNVLIDKRGAERQGPPLEIIKDVIASNTLSSYKEIINQ